MMIQGICDGNVNNTMFETPLTLFWQFDRKMFVFCFKVMGTSAGGSAVARSDVTVDVLGQFCTTDFIRLL